MPRFLDVHQHVQLEASHALCQALMGGQHVHGEHPNADHACPALGQGGEGWHLRGSGGIWGSWVAC